MATPVIMPKYEMAQETGTIVHWLKQDGDAVQKGEPILEVETDKVTMEVEAPAGGILRGISAASGDVVAIGEPIAYLVKPDEEWSPPTPQAAQGQDAAAAETAPSPPSAKAKQKAPAKATPVARRIAREHGVDLESLPHAAGDERITKADVHAYLRQQTEEEALDGKVRAVPAARRLARELDVRLEDVSGSGPRGRIQSADVQRLAEAQEEAGWAPFGKIRRTIPLSATRRTIARRMTESFQQVPQFTTGVDVLMSRALALVDDLNSGGEDDQRVTLTAFLIKACAWALTQHPRVNVSFDGDQIIEWAEVNVGVAVAIEDGLIVPVLQQADQKGLKAIARELDDLAARARSRQLTSEDLQGGTFTISNLGMFGIDRFTALINPPEAAILAVGRVRKQPTVTDADEVVVQPQATFTLTADHRALDGAIAARFLSTLQRAVEHPGHLLA